MNKINSFILITFTIFSIVGCEEKIINDSHNPDGTPKNKIVEYTKDSRSISALIRAGNDVWSCKYRDLKTNQNKDVVLVDFRSSLAVFEQDKEENNRANLMKFKVKTEFYGGKEALIEFFEVHNRDSDVISGSDSINAQDSSADHLVNQVALMLVFDLDTFTAEIASQKTVFNKALGFDFEKPIERLAELNDCEML